VRLLLACGIDGSVPGDYSITFSITNSAGRRAVVRRQLKIKAVCPEGEQLCDDEVKATVSRTILHTLVLKRNRPQR
jgi:zinc transporter 1/2/3